MAIGGLCKKLLVQLVARGRFHIGRKQLSSRYKLKWNKVKNVKPDNKENRENKPRIWEFLPVKVNNKILKYLTPEDLIKFKEVSGKIKTFIKNIRVIWFHKTMKRLGAIIKVLKILTAKSALAGEKLVATYSIST